MPKDRSTPAFPVTTETDHDGMNLRDYFAAKAMQSLIRSGAYNDELLAVLAYKQADAMMEARDK